MAQLDLTNILASGIPTPSSGVLSLYSELTGPPAKRLSTKDDAGAIVTLIGAATTDTGAGRLKNKDLEDATTFVVDDADTTKKLTFSVGGNTTGITLTLSSAQTTAQTLSIPNIAGADTLVTLGLAQTITGIKTMSGLNVITHSSVGGLFRNPANTFNIILTTPAITVADRTLNLPLIVGTDTLMCLGLAQTVTGILTLTTPVLGAATGTSLAMSSFIRTSATTTSAQGIGYSAGGAVVQATSKVTAFSLSRYTGTIQFAADSLAADTTSAGATWTNTAIAANDHVTFEHISGGTFGAYRVTCTSGAGTATVRIRNLTPGALAEAPVFRFMVQTSANA